jgi:hypothetical protein
MAAVVHITGDIAEVYEQSGLGIRKLFLHVADREHHNTLDTDSEESPVVNGS